MPIIGAKPAQWKPFWRKKRKRDRRQTSFSFLERPKKAIPAATRREMPLHCEIAGCEKPRQAADHICPIRLAAQSEKDPHDRRNLMSVCVSHNNMKKKAELYLAAGNRLSFLEYLRMRGWPMERVTSALALFGW
jgi:5-methylcytosine-specific restriction endonuclease McrA